MDRSGKKLTVNMGTSQYVTATNFFCGGRKDGGTIPNGKPNHSPRIVQMKPGF